MTWDSRLAHGTRGLDDGGKKKVADISTNLLMPFSQSNGLQYKEGVLSSRIPIPITVLTSHFFHLFSLPSSELHRWPRKLVVLTRGD